ncbi:hypothetical protein BHE74_00001192 [Ensete ventricosum]|nr:hypothetical protein BHE74_00001192 [Ensete ventricosum]
MQISHHQRLLIYPVGFPLSVVGPPSLSLCSLSRPHAATASATPNVDSATSYNAATQPRRHPLPAKPLSVSYFLAEGAIWLITSVGGGALTNGFVLPIDATAGWQ